MQRSSAPGRLRLPAARIGLPGALALAALACALIGAAAFLLRPPSFSSRRDAVAYALRQRGIAASDITIDHRWPDTVNNLTYGANLQVTTRERGVVPGRIECRRRDRDCYINVVRLGLDRLPIPDVSATRELPLLRWLEERYAAALAGRLPWQ